MPIEYKYEYETMVAISTAQTLVNPYTPVLEKAQDAIKSAKPTTNTPAVIINLSPAAQQALAKTADTTVAAADATKAVDSLLDASGAAIFGTAINSLKQYPPDLSTRLTELAKPGRVNTPAEIKEAISLSEERNAREYKAFGHFNDEIFAATTKEAENRLISEYDKAYVEYYDTLSPQEQNDPHFRGTRDVALADYKSFSLIIGQAPKDLSESQDPILSLFDKVRRAGFKLDDKKVSKILSDYKKTISLLNSSKENLAGNADKVTAASNRLLAVQSVIEQALKGDKSALGQIRLLANDPTSLNSFLSYAASLSTIQK